MAQSSYRTKLSDGTVLEGLSASSLRELVENGRLTSKDWVASENSERWIRADRVKGLFRDRPNSKGIVFNENLPGWRSIVQECRQFTPVIESVVGQGTGLVVSADGLILTNRHVIDGASLYYVTFFDGTRVKALAVHTDDFQDLAVIRCARHFGSWFRLNERVSRDFEAGDEVIAIGHPHGLTFTSTRGIISEPNRKLSEGTFVQTDVAINPGNSGGPLIDSRGKLVGINTQIRTDGAGLGFAIPGDVVFEYVTSVCKKIGTRQVSIPSDEEIGQHQEKMSIEDVIEVSLKTLEYSYSSEVVSSDDRRWTVTTRSRKVIYLRVDSNSLSIRHLLSEFDVHLLDDAIFLRTLLRLQNLPGLAKYAIDDESNLWIMHERSIEDLDVSEMCFALMDMVREVDKSVPFLNELFNQYEGR